MDRLWQENTLKRKRSVSQRVQQRGTQFACLTLAGLKDGWVNLMEECSRKKRRTVMEEKEREIKSGYVRPWVVADRMGNTKDV